jgi:hypothetical protein
MDMRRTPGAATDMPAVREDATLPDNRSSHVEQIAQCLQSVRAACPAAPLVTKSPESLKVRRQPPVRW